MASRFGSLLAELKRRRVYHVAVAYIVVGLGVLGAAELILDPLGLEGARPLIVVLTLLGFPLALVLAWAYEIKSEEPTLIQPLGGEAVPSSEDFTPPKVGVAEERKAIVVLPFDNMSPDPNDAYFSDGLTEEIITQLSYLRSLRVISRSSAMALKNTQKDVRTIGRELDVQYVMEGSVRKAGNSLRITAQLIDASSDEHLWAETYSRELEDVFEIQSEIALSVADAMQASLDARSVERIKSHPTESLDALDAYLLGRHHVWSLTEEGMSKAKSYFERALELDPDYASAHFGLAHWYLWAGGTAFSILPAAEAIPRGRAEAEWAITLDPDLGDAYGVLALIEMSYYWDREKAYELAKVGVERSPSSGWAWTSYAFVLLSLGRREESVEAVQRFGELEPLEMLALLNVAWVNGCAGRLDKALEYAKRSVEVDSGFFGTVFLAWVFQARGEHDKAWAEFARVQDHWEAIRRTKGAWMLAYAFARAGRLEDFEESVADLERRVAQGTAAWSEVALAYIGVRDYERALDCLERAPDERPPGSNVTFTLGFEPLFDPIRDNPRFQQVLKRLGLG